MMVMKEGMLTARALGGQVGLDFVRFLDARNEETANIFNSDTLQGSHWILPERSTQTARGPRGPSVRIKAHLLETRNEGHNLYPPNSPELSTAASL